MNVIVFKDKCTYDLLNSSNDNDLGLQTACRKWARIQPMANLKHSHQVSVQYKNIFGSDYTEKQ